MKLFGLDIRRAKAVTAAPGKTQRAIQKIRRQTLYRIKQSVSDWHDALEEAEDLDSPNNEELMRLYQELCLDPHLSALMDTILFQVRANKFNIYKDGEIDEEATELFTGRWFNEFIRHTIDARYFGFSYIQFDGVRNDRLTGITPVPREHIVPQWQVLKVNPHDYSGYDITKAPLDKWNLFIGSKTDLGLLAKAGPLVIWKKEVMQFWAAYNELFGQPVRVGKTNMTDKERVDNLAAAMENMSYASWLVADLEDQLEFLAASGTSGQDTYEKFIRIADEQLSKLFAGQTMVLDNGSSRSQSEVHERNLTSFVNAQMTEIMYTVNDDLIPRMISWGMPITDAHYFEWEQSESLTVMDKADIIAKISPYYKLDAEFIEQTLDVKLDEAGNEPSQMLNVENYYRQAMAHIQKHTH